jgi:DNA-binding SARP family transcriptional activator
LSTAVAAEFPSPPLALHLFGAFEVSVNGVPLPRLRSLKGQWLLALLTLHTNQEVERAWLTGLLWPDSSEGAAFANLRCSLKDLRRALGPEAARLRSSTTGTLCLDLTGAAVDVLGFDAALARGDAASLREVVALYRGPLLERCAEEWVFLERRAREEAYFGALERLAA